MAEGEWAPLHLPPCGEEGDSCATVGSLRHPPASTPTPHPPSTHLIFPAAKGTHVQIPLLIRLRRAVIGPTPCPPCKDPKKKHPIVLVGRWTRPLLTVFFSLFFSFFRGGGEESGGGGMEMGRGLGGGFSNISLLRGCLVNP